MEKQKADEQIVERVEEQTEEIKETEEQVEKEQTEEIGAFSEVIKLLEKANELCAKHEKSVVAVLEDNETPPEERRERFMSSFNTTVLAFATLDRVLVRKIKEKREMLRREKDRVIKQIYQ